MTITIEKEAFNRKISLLKSKLNTEKRNKFVRCYVWIIALYSSDTWTLRKLQIKVGNGEPKEFDHFKYLGSVLTRCGYCTREIKMRTVMTKEHLTEKYYS